MDGQLTFPEITVEDVYGCLNFHSVVQAELDWAVVTLDRNVNASRHTPIQINEDAEPVTAGVEGVFSYFSAATVAPDRRH